MVDEKDDDGFAEVDVCGCVDGESGLVEVYDGSAEDDDRDMKEVNGNDSKEAYENG